MANNTEFKFDSRHASVFVIGDYSARITPVYEDGSEVGYDRDNSIKVGSWRKYLDEIAIKRNTSVLTNLIGVYAYIRSLEDKRQYADCTVHSPVRDGVRPFEFETAPFKAVMNGYGGLVKSILAILPLYLQSYTIDPAASVYIFVE